ncbi:MAG: hypothetical protein NC913_07050 [Candidatus Omnitrophica bacterium]|nr:hypothetical protein [Candidatus Omnitrophota bacterium]
MTNKERLDKTFNGKKVDRFAVTSLYSHLYFFDHFTEITELPEEEFHKLLYKKPEEFFYIYKIFLEKVQFEIIEPPFAMPREERENIEFVKKNNKLFKYNRKTDEYSEIKKTISGHATDYKANEVQYIFDKEDIKKIKIKKAEDIIESGILDYAKIIVEKIGKNEFVLIPGFVGILWECVHYLGQTNTLLMLAENNDLIECLSKVLLEQQIEKIKAYSSTGSDAIFIDDAMAYSDVISVKHYEKFVLPNTTEMVREIHRSGKKAILIYFGGVMDRLELIVSTGADGLLCETSMKNYKNEIDQIVKKVGDKIVIFGNIDPIKILEQGTDFELEDEIKKQVEVGKRAKGFIISTGSPITPGTSLEKVMKFIDLGRKIGRI